MKTLIFNPYMIIGFQFLKRIIATMQHLFESKDYHWSLFIGHLVLERLLKANIVKRTNEHAPHSHDLRRLAKLSGMEFNPDHII